jgi:hypothetical protein
MHIPQQLHHVHSASSLYNNHNPHHAYQSTTGTATGYHTGVGVGLSQPHQPHTNQMLSLQSPSYHNNHQQYNVPSHLPSGNYSHGPVSNAYNSTGGGGTFSQNNLNFNPNSNFNFSSSPYIGVSSSHGNSSLLGHSG